MIRKTQIKPKMFTHEDERFKTERLGFLAANELLIKYMPTLLKVFKKLQSDRTEAQIEQDLKDQKLNIDIGAVIAEVGNNTLTSLAGDLFQKTYLDEEGTWRLIDPDCFEDHSEMFNVASEVFKFNFPDFFKGDSDTEGSSVSKEKEVVPSTAETPTEQKVDVRL